MRCQAQGRSTGAVRTTRSGCPVWAVWPLLFILAGVGPGRVTSVAAGPVETRDAQPAEVALPPGSPERKAILDALRKELGRYQDQPMVFVVRHLAVSGGWAWVDADPQSPDTASHYESVSALLRKRGGVWALVEMPCTEEENPECITDPDYFNRLRSRRPEVPRGILPAP